MNFWKNPEYSAIKVLLLIIVFVTAGFFVYKNFQDDSLLGKGSVFGSKTICDPNITIVSPNGGEIYTAGQTITVNWTSCGVTGDVAIFGIADGWLVFSPAYIATVPNTGTFTYTLPPTSYLTAGFPFGLHYRIRVQSVGTAVFDESDSLFTINPSVIVTPPIVTTVSAASITATTAVLNGNLVSTGGSTSVATGIEFGPTTTYGTTISTGTMISAGAFNGATTTYMTLTCNTLYHYRAKATNSAGTVYGADMTFKTLPCGTPLTVLTVGSDTITAASAHLKGNLISTGGSTSVVTGIEFGTTTSYGSTISTGTMISAGLFNGFTTTYSTLICNTLYHYRAKAASLSGTVYGADMTFTTSACTTPPTVVTSSGFASGPYTASIFGSLTSLGGAPSATLSFLYGTTASGTYTTAVAGIPATSTTIPRTFNALLSGLTCGTAYKFMPKAVAGSANATGTLASFTTMTCPGAVSTINPLTGTTATTAILKGNLTSLGGWVSPSVGFEYSPSPISPATTVRVTTGTLSSLSAFSAPVAGLVPRRTYFYRAWAHDPAYSMTSTYPYATINGAWATFTTP